MGSIGGKGVIIIGMTLFIVSVMALQPNMDIDGSLDGDDRLLAPLSLPMIDEPATIWEGSNLQGFNESIAKRYLYHSYASYCPEKKIQAWNCKWCKDSVTIVEMLKGKKTDTFGYVAYDSSHNAVVVSFRGTTTLVNWIEDLKFWKALHPFANVTGAKVAQGFFESYQSVAATMQRAVQQQLKAHTNASLIITGHSLGGALATLAAFDLIVSTGITPEVYTYGSPRVGDNGFANAYAARVPKTWRMTNHQDIVVHLPPHAFNFAHVTQEIFERQGKYKTDCKGGEDKACADGQLAISIPDHLTYMSTFWLCA